MLPSPNRRRRQLALAAAFVALDFGAARSASPANLRPVRIARGTGTTEQSLLWIAEEAGLFARLGLRAEFVAADSGNLHLEYRGIAQVAQRILEGGDAVIVATPFEPGRGGFLMASQSIRGPEQLAGARVGVLNAAGPSATAAGAVLERLNVTANLIALKSSEAIYEALASGAIDAGWLPVDLSFKGRAAFNWTSFEGARIALGGGYVTSRRLIASERGLVEANVKALASAVFLFKTKPDAVIPLLQRFLGVERAVAADLQAYYGALLRLVPAPSVFFSAAALRESLRGRYPAAERLQAADLVDSSIVDALARSGYLAQLHSGAR